MIIVHYDKYPYAPTTSMLSSLNYIGIAILAILALVFGISLFGHFSVGMLIAFLIILALLYFFIFIYNDKILAKLAIKEMDKNLRKKPAIALKYCQKHPEEFERIAGINPKFAAKYELDSNGTSVVRKKKK